MRIVLCIDADLIKNGVSVVKIFQNYIEFG